MKIGFGDRQTPEHFVKVNAADAELALVAVDDEFQLGLLLGKMEQDRSGQARTGLKTVRLLRL